MGVFGLVADNWRRGVLALFAVGVLQDVFRKLTPGAPAYFILWVGVVFGVVVLFALSRGAVRGLRPLYLQDRALADAWRFFIAVVLLQAIHAWLRWGSPLVPVLGLFFYLGPVVALLVGMAYAKSERWIDRFLAGYVLIMLPAVLTVYLTPQFGEQFPVLRDVGVLTGTQITIYDVGTALESYSGVLRVGELAAWHAATTIMFLSILMVRRPGLIFRAFTIFLIAALVGAILLTGRRKMLMTLVVFFSFQWVLLALLRRGLTKGTGTLLALVVGGTLAFAVFGLEQTDSPHGLYAQRGLSVFDSLDERTTTARRLAVSAWHRSDVIGLGAGVAGQGARFAGGAGSARAVGGAAEAGVGMILVELGLVGVIALLWLLYRLGVRVWYGLRVLAARHRMMLPYASAFVAMLVANLATFAVATQLYGDLLVLITLGLTAGMLFALVNAGLVQQRVRRHAARQAAVA
ncbi:MAG: hypothetical protein EA400_12695 [Chromatiaceae bacterium]|nr:MAG: hypothetical protein EA400_12695 [Chromatiaceae bacterium]